MWRAMTSHAAMHRYQRWTARLTVAVFAVGLLGLTFAPCEAMAGASGQATQGLSATDDCGHCPPAGDPVPHCAAMAPVDCVAKAQPATEFRRIEQAKPVAIMAAQSLDPVEIVDTASHVRLQKLVAAPRVRASLQQRFCSFLK